MEIRKQSRMGSPLQYCFQTITDSAMSDDDFKFNVDMSKVKNSKLYSKFVKSIESGVRHKDDSKPAQPPAEPPKVKAQRIDRPQRSDKIDQGDRIDKGEFERNTLVKYPEVNVQTFGHTTPPQFAQPYNRRDQGREESPPKEVLQVPIRAVEVREGRENRRGGTFRAEFGNRDNDLGAGQPTTQQTAGLRPTMQNAPSAVPAAVQRQTIYTSPSLLAPFQPAAQVPQAVSKPTPPPPMPSQSLPTQNFEQLFKQYKSKFQKLTQSYEQLKNTSMNENRQRKSELISYQETIQILKEKVYEVQMKEDELTMENQRLKQKISTETVIKTRLEEENKELSYQIEELKDMLENKEAALKKKSDEVTYWKTQADTIKADMQNIKLSNQRLSNSLREYEEEHQFLKRQMQNKQSLQSDMKQKVSVLLRENAKVKDELHYMTSKVTDLEHENYSLRTDLKRQGSLAQVFRGEPREQRQLRQQQRDQSSGNIQPQQPTRRRGEFNKQRQKANEMRGQMRQPTRQFQNYRGGVNPQAYNTARNQPPPLEKQMQQLTDKKNTLEEEVEKMRDIKAMSGAMRKKKIDLEREVEALSNQINQLKAQQQRL